MYTLVKAFSRTDRRVGRWVEVDISNVIIATLSVTYGDVWMFIHHPTFEVDYKALRFSKITGQINATHNGMTVSQYLNSIGNQALPFEDYIPEFSEKLVRYNQAWHAGYDFTPVVHHSVGESNLSDYEKPDLKIIRDDLDSAFIGKNALFTVNGFFHLTDYNNQDAFIIDGNKSIRKANDNQIGVYSFREVGEIQCIPIKPDMVASQRPGAALVEGVYVHIPSEYDLTDKSVLLVVGGYLQALNKAYIRTGERSFKIEFGRMNALERYYDSYNKIDLSSLGLHEYESSDSLVMVDQLMSDEAIRGYLTLSQSFFVIVDSPSFFMDLEKTEDSALPGRYYGTDKLYMPHIGAYGRMVEHHYLVEDGVTVIAGSRNLRYDYDFQRMRWKRGSNIDNGKYPASAYRDTGLFEMQIGVER